MFPAVNKGHSGLCLARRRMNNSPGTLGKRQGLLGGHYKKRPIWEKLHVHFYRSSMPGNSTSGWGVCHRHMGHFSKHRPTRPQHEILQGEQWGMPLFLHVGLSAMGSPSYWWQGSTFLSRVEVKKKIN